MIYYARAEAENYLPDVLDEDEAIRLRDPQAQKTINFTLIEGESDFRVRVQNQNQEPIPGVDIWLWAFDSQIRGENDPYKGDQDGTTNAEGELAMNLTGRVLPKSNLMYKITAEPPVDAEYDEKSVRIDPEKQQSVTITLEDIEPANADVHGVVLTEEGRPLSEFSLYTLPTYQQYRQNVHSTEFDWIPFRSPQGKFHLKALDSRLSPFVIAAYHPERGLAFSRFINLKPLEVRRNVTIQYSAPLRVTGTVVNSETQTPVEGVKVWAQLVTDHFREQSLFQSPGSGRVIGTGRSSIFQGKLTEHLPRTETGANGQFVLENVAPKTFWLFINKRYFEPQVEKISPQPNQSTLDLGIIPLTDQRRTSFRGN